MKIVTDYCPKPIPIRDYDWLAVDSDTYDGAPDSATRNHVGHGKTEAEAIASLEEILLEEDEFLRDMDAQRDK